MINERIFNMIYFSEYTKILKKENKNYFIVIWPNLPYYIALPINYENFILDLFKNDSFNIHEIESYLKKENFKILFEYLLEKNIISQSPISQKDSENTNLKKLYYISLQVTDRCNLRCRHCYASAGELSSNNELTTDEYFRLIDQLSLISDINLCTPIITGGEPLLRDDILEIVDYILSKYEKTVIVTNGLLINSSLIKEFEKRPNLMFQISLDGAHKKTHEDIRGKNTFEHLLSNIRKMTDRNIKVSLSPLCSSKFIDEIDEYFDLAKNLNVQNIQFQPVQYIGRALKNSDIHRSDSKKLIKKIFHYYFKENYHSLISSGLESKSIIHVRNLNKLNSCGTGHGTMYIASNGDVFSCPNMKHIDYKIGNVLEKNIEEMYFCSPIYIKLRSLNINKDYPTDCVNCEVKHFCGGGCRGVCLTNTGSLLGKAIECNDLKRYFSEILWSICENKNFFKKESESWIQSKIKLSNEILH